MTETEFRETLPCSTACTLCGAGLDGYWSVSRYGHDWIAIGLAKCEKCSWLKVAAAGSTEQAHTIAQGIRSRLVKGLGN